MKKSDADLVASVARIKNRVAVKDYYYDTLPKDIRALSFTVSNLETLRQVEMVKKSLERAIENGEDFKSWKDNLDTSVLKSLSDARLETVYRTNVHTVYNQSTRYNALTSNVTPYLMYTAVGDERTRPAHLELDGVTKRADSAFWNSHTPPLGFNCRCGVIPMTKEDAEAEGISKKANDKFPEAEEGFGNKKMGDVLSTVNKETEKQIAAMPNSPLKSKFKEAQSNISSLVDIWFDKNKNIFNQE